jgi:hypothetical protein
LKYVFDKLK